MTEPGRITTITLYGDASLYRTAFRNQGPAQPYFHSVLNNNFAIGYNAYTLVLCIITQ